MKPMTPAECATRANVSLSLVYAVLRSGRLPSMRIGCRGRGKWLVEPGDFEAWMESCKRSELPDDGPYVFLK